MADSLLFQTVRHLVVNADVGVTQLIESYAQDIIVITVTIPRITIGVLGDRLGVLARENGGGAIPITFSICNNFVKSLDK